MGEPRAHGFGLGQFFARGAAGRQQACFHIGADQALAGQVAERRPVFEIDHGQAGGKRCFEFAQVQVAATPSGAVGGCTQAGLQVRITGHLEKADPGAVAWQPLSGKARADHLHRGDQVVHAFGERPDAIEARFQWMRTDTADATISRLEPGNPAARCRHPHRTTGVGADGDVRQACRDRRSRTAGRAARHTVRRLRIDRSAGPVVDAGHAERQFMQVGLADDLPASVEDRIDHLGVLRRRRCIGERTAA
ncbi:hypothetical protein D3C72_1239650 [compost metagenome]